MIKLIVLDLDGTLIDTKDIYLKAIVSSIKKKGYRINNLEKKVLSLMGIKLPIILTKLKIKKQDILEIKEMVHSKIYKKASKVKPAEGINDLKKINLPKVIISNSPLFFIKETLKYIGFIPDKIMGTENFSTKASGIKKIAKIYKISTQDILYVGDRKYDAIAAKKANCVSALINHKISWGDEKELIKAKPDYIIKSFKEIQDILLKA